MKPLLTIILASLSFLSLAAADSTKAKSLFDYWAARDRVTEVTIHIDLGELEANRMKPDALPATLSDGEREFTLEVEVRGRYRRRNCVMPPLKLHFDKKWLQSAGYNKHNDFKLVTHCAVGPEAQEYILREKLAYELYQVLDPRNSYRTQLLMVTYVDTRDGSTQTSYGILIEDTDEMKDRLGAKTCKDCFGVELDRVANARRVALFNYLIGNHDYDFKMMRNVKLLRTEGTDRLLAVPYDFDFSGLVNATYAGHTPVTDSKRHLLWNDTKVPSFAGARGQFLYQQDELLAVVANFTELSEASRADIQAYLLTGLANLQVDPEILAR